MSNRLAFIGTRSFAHLNSLNFVWVRERLMSSNVI